MSLRRSYGLLLIAGAFVLVGAVIFWTLPRSVAQVASGQIGSGPWSAWAYDSGSGLCLEIRAAGRNDARICGLGHDRISIWRPHAPDGEESFVAGTTNDRDAKRARLLLGDGSQVEAEIAWPHEASDLGYFVMSLPASAAPGQVDLLASDGNVLETTSAN